MAGAWARSVQDCCAGEGAKLGQITYFNTYIYAYLNTYIYNFNTCIYTYFITDRWTGEDGKLGLYVHTHACTCTCACACGWWGGCFVVLLQY